MKQSLKIVVSVASLLLMAGGCTSGRSVPPQPTPEPNAFIVDVKVDKPVYKIGEFITLTVRASQECYITLYDISTVGQVTQIFPNLYAKDTKIGAGVAYRIPTPDDKFDFEVTGPPGVERVRAVCTKQNVNLFKERQLKAEDVKDFSTVQVFPEIAEESAQFEKTLNEELKSVAPSAWTEGSVSFQVQ